MDMRAKERLVMRVSILTLVVNTVLATFKLLAGILGSSRAMVSDAIHTFSDGISTVIVMIGIRVSSREPDNKHQYGYERYECVSAILLAVMLGIVGFGIGYNGVEVILNMREHTIAIPTLLPLIASLVSIAVKEGMYWYTILAARRIQSGALKADAWHHRSDAISSVGSFIGILGARLGLPILDPIASILISFFILKTAYDVFMDAIRKMTDTAADDETVDAIRNIVLGYPGVLGIDTLYTRVFADRIFVDIDVYAGAATTLSAAEAISSGLCERMYEEIPSIKRGHIHILPAPDEG